MTPPDTNPADDPAGDRLVALVRTAGRDVPPPDRAFLARLGDESTAAFLAAGSPPASPALPRRSAVFTTLARLSLAAVAAGVLLAIGVSVWPTRTEAAPLVRALDAATDADTLHLRVSTPGRAGEVWVARPNKLRWEESAGKYEVSEGARLLRVDEAANRVTPGQAAYFRADRPGVNLFALVGLPVPSPSALRAATPAERVVWDGAEFDVYRVTSADRDGKPGTAEILVDVATGKLRSLRALTATPGVPPVVLAKLEVLDDNPPVPAKTFAVPDTLAEDGRVGKVADVQGVVGLKPVGGQRWTPVRPNVLLKPGDWVRADLRGANAATLRLLPRATVVLGPGALVEVVKPTRVRLHEGEAEISPAKGTPVELLGPGGAAVTVTERTHYRVAGDALMKVPADPPWLKGFKGATASESLGSLVAKVDGRNVPLTVGYHRVSVEIRDQIARTTVDESFVNHTDSQLEGAFHFPLPADASISGFAMAVGDEMVPADVVEKQRAREIFEEIMREKRDPGLLEWAGGNVFKARVWPILPHSEKRVRITYTQVLPRTGSLYRYSYALQSEMLQQHPLKDLSIDVRVSSASPLKAVTSPTHTVRSEKTEYAARLQFAAQEHTPTKDFEAVVEVADAAPAVAVIPHRRGGDGYFLVQVTLPTGAATDRTLVADGEPLSVVLVCDTSASMDPGQRATQTILAAALLDALSPKDSFNLAAADVATDWVFPAPQPATPANVLQARSFLAARVSLGWSDLDRAFADAFRQCPPGGHIVYLGDGIVTTGDANPQAFAARLKGLYTASNCSATVHAVALGSTFEAGVLKAAGGLGGGSFRRVTAEQGPAAVALDLLGEMTRPPVRDLRVAFNGWNTAGVYPGALPNLVPGTQQILIGRYKPEGKDRRGEVVVTGSQGGKEVRFAAAVTLADAEAGNSFVPRLWAKMHLDALLEKPQTDAVKGEVIALSEEYGIITPYTSFLVLESDADRARFGVKRRFQMRDGEQFFAKGADEANFALAREQMKRAASWRTGLRRDTLARLATLGRDPRAFGGWSADGRVSIPTGETEVEQDWEKLHALHLRGNSREELRSAGGGQDYHELNSPSSLNEAEVTNQTLGLNFGLAKESNDDGLGEWDAKLKVVDKLARGTDGTDGPRDGEWAFDFSDGREKLDKAREVDGYFKRSKREEQAEYRRGFLAYDEDGLPELQIATLQRRVRLRQHGQNSHGLGWSGGVVMFDPLGVTYARGVGRSGLFDGLFPHLPTAPAAAKPRKNTWPAEARDLARSLVRRDALAKVAGGVKVEQVAETVDPRDGAATPGERRLVVHSPAGWAARVGSDSGQTVLWWCDGKERGVCGTAFGLGRTRAATPADVGDAPFALDDFSLTPLDQSHAAMSAAVERAAGATVLVLKREAVASELRVTIDPEKHVVRRVEHRHESKLTRAIAFDDFVEVGGTWWAREVVSVDGDGHRTGRTTRAVTALPADRIAAETAAATLGRENALLLRSPGVSAAKARAAVAANTATADDEFALLDSFAATQQWDKAVETLAGLEKRAGAAAGSRWLRAELLRAGRRHEELQRWLTAAADGAVALPKGDRAAVAGRLLEMAREVLGAHERLAFLDRLKPASAGTAGGLRRWTLDRAAALREAGRPAEATAVFKELAARFPRDARLQLEYADELFRRGDGDAGLAVLTANLDPKAGWTRDEAGPFRTAYADRLEGRGRYPELSAHLAAWVKLDPESETPYARHLAALVRGGDIDAADALAGRWLQEAHAPGKLTPAAAARFRAAAGLATGRGYNLSFDREDTKWAKTLAAAARAFAARPDRDAQAEFLLTLWQFVQTPEARAVRAEFLDRFVAGVCETPTPRLLRHLSIVMYHTPEVTAETWARLVAGLRARWTKEPDADLQQQLGQALAPILRNQGGEANYLAFLREQRTGGPEEFRAAYTAALFNALLQAGWTADREAEAVALLADLGDADRPDARRIIQVHGLHELTDHMVQARARAALHGIANPEKLTRTELAMKRADTLTAARKGFAERLATAAPAGLRAWFAVERLTLLSRTDADPKVLAAECWAYLGDAPKPQSPNVEPSVDQILGDVLRERYLAAALHFATDPKAAPELVARTRAYLDAAVAAEPGESRGKAAVFDFLVALDEPKELEAALTAWAKAGDPVGRWRTALGYVLAEQGRVAEAVALFEAVERDGVLTYPAHRTLAAWYMTVNKRDAHEKALIASLKALDEDTLARMVSEKLAPWQRGRGQSPAALDRDVPRLFAALFEKGTAPQNHLHALRQFYQATHDFRLLAPVADAVVGHTAGRVYPFLAGLRPVLDEVRDEATADQLLARVEAVRAAAKTPTDLRALDLLEAQVRRRASEILNQPGPHAVGALAAMRRAFDRPCADGERSPMSDLLRDLGAIGRPELAAEQLRELRDLLAAADAGTPERLHLAHNLATTLGLYARNEEAADGLAAALVEYAKPLEGRLPPDANAALMTLIQLHERGIHFDKAEGVLTGWAAHPANVDQAEWFASALDQVHVRALSSNGFTSLGSGTTLYRALAERLIREATAADPNGRRDRIAMLCSVYRTAGGKSFPGVGGDVKVFARNGLSNLLTPPFRQHTAVVGDVANALRSVVGPAEAVGFLVERLEHEPAWHRLVDEDVWRHHGSSVAQWWAEAKTLPADVEAKLLTHVLDALRRELRTGRLYHWSIHHAHHSYYWAEKEADFARVAGEVYEERKESGPAAVAIAQYLYAGCRRPGKAIDILFAADAAGKLDDDGRLQLVRDLHEQNRHAESFPLLTARVAKAPDDVQARLLLLTAFDRTDKRAELTAAFAAAEAHFRHKDRWHEGTMASLLAASVEHRLFERGTAIGGELIALRRRSNSGGGDGTLSRYYGQFAHALSGLGKTAEAVEAAGAAIVSWGPNANGRAEALGTLKAVLAAAADLDAVVRTLDAQTAATGLVNPVVRKAVGQVFFDRGQFRPAIAQLRIAADAQPNDAETVRLLIECQDKLNDAGGAIAQVLRTLEVTRRDIKRYEDLGKRYAALGRAADAERAYTSVVEVLPNEAEGHALLAEIRQRQDRWADAAAHWEQVSRVRSLEPTGLLGLASVQVHEKQFDKAADTLAKLKARTWPAHFPDASARIAELERQLNR